MKFGYRYSVAPALLLLPFLYAMFFTFPFGDDFARAVLARGLFDIYGGLRDLVVNWLGWSGRYAHHFMVVFLGDAAMSRAGYGAVCLGVFSLYGIAVFGIVSRVAAGARLQERLFLALVSLLALAAGHPALNITYYVLTDALGLGLANAMVLMFIFALCRLWYLPELRRRDVAFAVFCSAFATGCYEHAAIASVVAAALALWMAYRSGHPHRAAFLRVAVATLLFLLVSFLAPGNFNRQRIRDVGWDRIVQQLWVAGGDWLAIVFASWRTHFALLALFLGLAVTPKARAGTRALPAAGLAAAGLAAFVAVSAGIVIIQALSDVPVSSTHKLPASIHLLLGMVFAFVLMACGQRLRARVARVPAAALAAPLLLLFAVSANTVATFRSIVAGQLDAYAAHMTRRLEVLGAVHDEDVKLAPLAVCPFPACPGDPVPDSSSTWPARYIALLYGQRSVVVAAPDLSQASASLQELPPAAWTRIPGSPFDATYRAIRPGPNASYEDGWVFFRATHPAPAPSLGVLSTRQEAFLGKPRRPRLAQLSPALYGAPLGLADPADPAAVSVSLDGSDFFRLPTARQ